MAKLSRKVIARFCASGTIQEDDRELYEYALLSLGTYPLAVSARTADGLYSPNIHHNK